MVGDSGCFNSMLLYTVIRNCLAHICELTWEFFQFPSKDGITRPKGLCMLHFSENSQFFFLLIAFTNLYSQQRCKTILWHQILHNIWYWGTLLSSFIWWVWKSILLQFSFAFFSWWLVSLNCSCLSLFVLFPSLPVRAFGPLFHNGVCFLADLQ